MLVLGAYHSDSVFLYKMINHHNRSSYRLSLCKHITQLLTVLLTLHISYLGLIYFVSGSLYLLIALACFSYSYGDRVSVSPLTVILPADFSLMSSFRWKRFPSSPSFLRVLSFVKGVFSVHCDDHMIFSHML